jgi:tetratricopeptide (TPR) repeat protein
VPAVLAADLLADVDSWASWLEVGRRQTERLAHEKARDAFLIAARIARHQGDVSAEALARASAAASARALGDASQAWDLTQQALRSLRLTDLPPERTPPAAARDVETRLARTEDLQAYATIAKVRGRLLLQREQFDGAGAAIAVLETLSRVLDDARLAADACHLRGLILLEEGTHFDVGVEELVWQRAKDHALLEQASQCFSRAHMRRPVDDTLGHGHAWRQEAKTLWLLGETRRAARAAAQAHDLLNASLARAQLYLDRGRWEVGHNPNSHTEALLSTGAVLAWEMRSPMLLWTATSGLADLYAVAHHATRDGRRAAMQKAMECCATALLAWPLSPGLGDVRRFRWTITLFRALAENPSQELDRALQADHFPCSLLAQLPHITPDHVQRVRQLVTQRR